MDVEILKQGLKEILNEDISNRGSVAELRRSIFLQSSNASEKEAVITAREEKITELNSEISYFKNQLAIRETALEERHKSYEEERQALLVKLSEKEKETAQLWEELGRVSEEAKAAAARTEEISRLSVENSNYAAKIRELIEHIAQLQTSHENYERENASLKLKAGRAGELKKEEETWKSKVEQLQAENAQLKTQLSDHAAVLEAARTASERSISGLETANADLAEELKAIRYSFEQQAEALKAANEELQAENSLLENKNSEITALNAELQAANFEFLTNYANLKLSSEETIAVLKDEIAQMESLGVETVENYRNEIAGLKAGNAAAAAVQAQLQAANDELSGALLTVKAELKNLEAAQAELQAVNAALGVYKESYSSAQQKVSELESALEALRAIPSGMSEEEKQELLARTEVLQEEAERLNSGLKEAQAAYAQKAEEQAALQQANAALSTRVAALEEQNAELGGETGRLTAEIAAHLNSLAELEARIAALSEELEEKNARLESVNAACEAASGECGRQRAELEEAGHTYEKLMQEADNRYREELEQARAVAAVTNEEMENAKLSSLSHLLNEKEEQILSWKKEYEQLRAEKEELENSIRSSGSDAETKIAELQQIADALNVEKLKLEETITDLKRELFRAEEQLEKQAEEKNSGQNEEFIEGLFKKIDLLNEKSQKLQAQKEEMEKQVPGLLAKMAELSETIDNQKNKPEGLEKDNNSPNLAGMLAGSLTDKKSAKLKINELVREIDRCIAMLNAQS